MCFRLPFSIPHRYFYISMRSFENVNDLTIYIKSIRIKGLVRNTLHGNRHLKHLCEHIPFSLYRVALCLQIFPNYFARIIMACKMPRILRSLLKVGTVHSRIYKGIFLKEARSFFPCPNAVPNIPLCLKLSKARQPQIFIPDRKTF